jgi:putative transposase
LFQALKRQGVKSSFECCCLTAGVGALEQMLCEGAEQVAGAPHSRSEGRVGHRWGLTKGKIGFHGGRVTVHRPRVRSYEGQEVQSADLDGGPGRGLAWPLGHEPDAD